MSLNVEMHLDFPDNPKEFVYEVKRYSLFAYIYGRTFLSNRRDMECIHELNILLQEKYGDDWIDLITFNNEKTRQTLKLMYDFEDKEKLIQAKKQRIEYIKELLQMKKD